MFQTTRLVVRVSRSIIFFDTLHIDVILQHIPVVYPYKLFLLTRASFQCVKLLEFPHLIIFNIRLIHIFFPDSILHTLSCSQRWDVLLTAALRHRLWHIVNTNKALPLLLNIKEPYFIFLWCRCGTPFARIIKASGVTLIFLKYVHTVHAEHSRGTGMSLFICVWVGIGNSLSLHIGAERARQTESESELWKPRGACRESSCSHLLYLAA